MIGQRFCKLTVISQAPSYIWKNKLTGKVSHRKQWLCECDCGKTLLVQTNKLTGNHIIQCQSCSYSSRPQSQRRLSSIERVFNLHVRDRAKKDNIELTLNVDEFSNLITQNCYYCDESPKDYEVYKNKYAKSEIIKFNGIDRIDSNKGYIVNNCVTCCWKCNSMKSNRTINEFIEHIKKIFNFQRGKNV